MKATLTGELLLLVGLLALAWFVYVQQAQLVELEQELDRMRLGGSVPPVPVASDNGAEAAAPAEAKPKPKGRTGG